MKKRVVCALLASALLVAAAGCGNNEKKEDTKKADTTTTTTAAPANNGDATTKATEGTTEAKPAATEQGKVLNIYGWNEEFKGFFEKYYAGTAPINDEGKMFDKAPGIPDGVTVNWVINPSDGGVYQQKLDEALRNQSSAAADDKVDLILAEADYILKYTNSDYTLDVATIGVNQVPTEYQYTVSAASDANGKVKGISFQCCPSALIYRRSIAKEVLGTDDPAEVQAKLDSWAKFDAVAADAKAKGYYMTPSYCETYRVFSNNATSPWVTDGKLTMPAAVENWLTQAETYMKNGYTLEAGIWGEEKTKEMTQKGKSMCFFGPAWYFNFCMGAAKEGTIKDNDGNVIFDGGSTNGDWAICAGPQAHFWGGTWLLAATGTDNEALVADIMKAFTENEDICSALVENEGQFTNNTKVNEKYASDPNFGSEFLGGQNPNTVFCDLAKGIKFENVTMYDQLCNEGLQTSILDFLTGNVSKENALGNFYDYIQQNYAELETP